MGLLIQEILRFYIFIIIADVILSYLPELRAQKWAQYIKKAADLTQKPIRDALPKNLPLDPSPMIVIFLINLLTYLL
jgi:YggT family protein